MVYMPVRSSADHSAARVAGDTRLFEKMEVLLVDILHHENLELPG